MGQHPESTHKNQHYASFPGFLAKKQEFQSLQCRGHEGETELKVGSKPQPEDRARARPDFARPTSRPKPRCFFTPGQGAPKRSDGGVVLVLERAAKLPNKAENVNFQRQH